MLFVFVLFDIYFSSRATSSQVGRRHCAVERVRWTMQRNGATQAQGVEGRRPCANAQRPSAQSRDRFLTFCLLCLYGWLAMGQKLSVNSYILAHSVAHPKGATARGEVAANAMSRRKGNNSELPSVASCSPQFRLRLVSSPINGGAFWCGINSYIKPALKGEVGFAQAKAGGVIK